MTMLDRLLRAPTRRSAAVLVVVALATPLSMVGQLPGAAAESPTDPCALTAILENPCRPLLGAESNGYTPTTATFPERVKEHETRIGRAVDMVHIYVTSNSKMTTKEKSVASEPGRIALVNWRLSTSWASAADGSLDDQISDMAGDLKTIPQKVMLTIGHEPEIHVSPGGGDPDCPSAAGTDSRGTTQDYVNMWQHVRAQFDAAGVNNVVWVMNYLGYSTYFECAEALWPGNAYVDWVMWDPYPKNQSFAATVGGFYDYLTTHSDAEHDFLSKPWGLAEWGYTGTTKDKAYAMYDDARAALHANTFPKLKAYVIWDNIVNGGGNDDRVGYDSESILDSEEQRHYNLFANDPAFSPDHTPPTAVTSLAADSVSGTGAHLTWTAATDEVRVAGYRVYRDGTLLETLAPDATGYTDTGLDDAHTYQYSVRAVDPSSNEAAPGDGLPVSTPDVTAPLAPATPRATVSGPSVKLTWTKPADNVGVTSYAVYRGTTLVGRPTAAAFTDPAPPQAVRLSYTVRALDAAQNVSPGSSPATATVRDTIAPGNPTAFTATAARRQVTLTWGRASDNVGVTRYWLYRGTTRIASLTSSTLRYTNTGLRTGTTYAYKLISLDAAGNRSTGSRASAKAK